MLMYFTECKIRKSLRFVLLISLILLRHSSAFPTLSGRPSLRQNSLIQLYIISEKSKDVGNAQREINLSRSDFISTMILTGFTVVGLSNNPRLSNAIDTVPTLDLPLQKSSATIPSLKHGTDSNKTLANTNNVSITSFQESVSGFVSGAAVTTAKTLVKYPLDTATVRLQMPGTFYSIYNLPQLFQGSYQGITLPLITNIPGGAVFFAIKDSSKSMLRELGLSKYAATCIAVGIANLPYWLIRNPSEVIKTRQQAGVEGYGPDINGIDAIRQSIDNTIKEGIDNDGFNLLYKGYWENIIYSYPADVIKFLCYDKLSSGKETISPMQGAVYGAVSTEMAQFVTTPLDVIRNRIMANTASESSVNDSEKPSYLQRCIQLAKEEGPRGFFAGATTRVGKAILSGAIQFATYEETKSKVTEMIQSKINSSKSRFMA